MVNRNDIEIGIQDDVFCEECNENLKVVSGYFEDQLIYSMDIHSDTAESEQEIIDMVIDTSLDIIEEQETRASLRYD